MMQKFFAASRRMGFTRNEAVVVVFLSVSALAGGAVRLATPAEERHSLADAYRRHDSAFAARSAAVLIQSAHVSTDGRKTASEASRNPEAPSQLSIDLNTAGAEKLAMLPGIGPSIARRIIEYRDEHGPFRKSEELMNVKGIGPKKFERIKPYLSTAPARKN